MEPTLPGPVACGVPRAQGSSDVVPTNQPNRQYGNITVDGQGLTVVGDIYNSKILLQSSLDREVVAKFGLCLGAAPQIDSSYFVGRVGELDEIARILQPGSLCLKQNRLILGGMGGVGKTQLAIAYVRRHSQDYDSIFWLNATSQITLQTDLRLVAGRLLRASELERLNDEQVLNRVHEWLSNTRNTRWLLILDNYDEPAQFDISKYCPYTAHGSILITSRLPEHVNLSCDQVRVQPLDDIQESLEILEKRSRRPDIRSDPSVRVLAEKLAGLPLALATAGTYLSKRASTGCREYLELYEQRWNVDPRRPVYLQDYQNRTLYTTWDLSYGLLERDDADAAQALQLLAYLDNQSFSFELFRASPADGSPIWLQRLGSNRAEFESIMSTLAEYCFIEIHTTTKSYSMHNCLHDWTLFVLNRNPNQQLYTYVFDCIAAHIRHILHTSLQHSRYADLAAHAARIVHPRILRDQLLHSVAADRLSDTHNVAVLLFARHEFVAAEQMYRQALRAHEIRLGRDHPQTLYVLNHLAGVKRILQTTQGDLKEAEGMCQRVLLGYEKAFGADHPMTVGARLDLGRLYLDQGQVDRAEQMYQQALAEMETAFGPHHDTALRTLSELGNLYLAQKRLDEAAQVYQRALNGYDKAFGASHFFTLMSKRGLAEVSYYQGNLYQAELLYKQVFEGYRAVLGPDSLYIATLLNQIGLLYHRQGRFREAEVMFEGALSGYQRWLSWNPACTRLLNECPAKRYRRKEKLKEPSLHDTHETSSTTN